MYLNLSHDDDCRQVCEVRELELLENEIDFEKNTTLLFVDFVSEKC
jgi:hypothetical protein